MGWRQMILGAVVGQVAEFMRERKQHTRTGPDDMDARPADVDSPDRAIGGRLNPLNAAEDMLKRVIDHAQYRTDQSLSKGVEELRQATERQWPLMAEQAQISAERAVELAGERLEGSSKRIAEDVAARTSIVIDEKLSKADAMLAGHREALGRQITRAVLVGGVVLLVVGAILIILAAILLR